MIHIKRLREHDVSEHNVSSKMRAIPQILARIESRWENVARGEIVNAVADAEMEEVYVATSERIQIDIKNLSKNWIQHERWNVVIVARIANRGDQILRDDIIPQDDGLAD